MSATASPGLLTAAELLAMPANGIERWLIRGELREKPMTVRNRFHSAILIRIGQFLANWLDQQPEPRGQILGGEAGVRLRRNPDSVVGVDVAYISAEAIRQQTKDTTLIEGVPVLTVEILSPSDTQEEVKEKTDTYLDAGVALVWIVDPHDRTILAYRPGQPPQLFTSQQELTAESQLPGFRVAVSRFFA